MTHLILFNQYWFPNTSHHPPLSACPLQQSIFVTMANTPGVANVKLVCLCCQLEFAGAKKSIVYKDRNAFVVKSTGLSTLHLCAVQCQGACRKFYMAHNLPLNAFSLSPPSVARWWRVQKYYG
jgi:hypothetical protein